MLDDNGENNINESKNGIGNNKVGIIMFNVIVLTSIGGVIFIIVRKYMGERKK